MKITDYIKEHILYLDGGMGTLLQARGLVPGELPECWNITHPEIITDIHRDYYNAGSNVVNTNTFGANSLKFSDEDLEEIVKAAIENARNAAKTSSADSEKWVALDIGPSGRMLAPYGDFDFEDAVKMFAKTVKLGVKYGADLIFIETMNDSYETKAALLAAKENSDLPVFVSNAYGEDGKLMTGAAPAAMVAMLAGMGADAIGVNCSLGPKALAPIVREYLKYASEMVKFVKENTSLSIGVAGYPEGHIEAESFEKDIEYLKLKVRLGAEAIFTQLFFDNSPFLHFLEKISDLNTPVIPGILPISNLEQGRKMTSMCGTSIPKKNRTKIREIYQKRRFRKSWN